MIGFVDLSNIPYLIIQNLTQSDAAFNLSPTPQMIDLMDTTGERDLRVEGERMRDLMCVCVCVVEDERRRREEEDKQSWRSGL